MGQRTVVVIAGGERVDAPRRPLPAGASVVAADSGVDYAHALGLRVDVAIGDFDSVSAEGLDRAAAEGARVERHPAAKDQTDLELALGEALRLDASAIVVLGIGGGRIDHQLANLLVLAHPRFAPARVTAYAGTACIHVVRGGEPAVALEGAVDEIVSLVPVGGPALGVVTIGLQYPLHREELVPGTTRGVSNVIVATPATVELEAGVLLAVLPGGGVHDA